MPDFHIKKLKYDIDEILRRFDLRVSMHCTILDEWLSVAIPSDYILPQQLQRKQQHLLTEGMMWNEEELKMHFLSLIFDHADIELPDKIKLFYERPLSATVQNTPLNGFSKTYDATRTDELIQIIHILRHLKYRIQY